MRGFIYWIVLSILFSLGALASNLNRLYGDIDGDGKDEVVVWKKSHTFECGDFYRVSIYRKDGSLLWKSPKSSDMDDDYAFGEWDFGISMPEAIVDINGDGHSELLAPSPISDVSPQYYRIFTWNGEEMAICHPEVLMLSKDDANRFVWVNPFPKSGSVEIWVSRLQPVKNSSSKAVAEVFKVKDSSSVEVGKALLHFYPFGAKVIKWIKSVGYSAVTSDKNSYTARIGKRDHYNSQGKKLNTISAILRQDRANYYKGIGDAEDTGVGKFKSIKDREMMDKMVIEPVGISVRDLKTELVKGSPLLRVEILPNRLRVKILNN